MFRVYFRLGAINEPFIDLFAVYLKLCWGMALSTSYVDASATTRMSAVLFLARHAHHSEVGRVLSGRSDIALSEDGRDQARRLAHLCEQRGIREIQSSPTPRAWQTAELIAAPLALGVERTDALDEIDFGDWAGRSFVELDGDPLWPLWNSQRDRHSPPGGESMAAAVQRITSHLEMLAQRGRSHVLCVSHCDMIRGVVAHYLGLSLARLLRFDIDPASLSAVVLSNGEGRVLSLNEVPS